MSSPQSNAAGIYVHLPFCRVRCTYCPFVITTDQRQESDYLQAIESEIRARGDGTASATTIYLGGGTPSRTDPKSVARLLEVIRDTFRVETGAEITLEANPEDVDENALGVWREAGINRLSIGVQSFHDGELLPLGRLHGAERALQSVRSALRHGFRTSLDLILGLPGQTAESFRDSLEVAIGSGVGHLSLYMLDVEEGTSLAKGVELGKVSLPDEGGVAESYLFAIEALGGAGIEQYEISNFARPGEASRHNLGYWERRPYAGFGVGAHSYDGVRRWANTADLGDYLRRIRTGERPESFEERLGEDENRRETIFLNLRRTRGMLYDELARLCGRKGEQWAENGIGQGWVRRDADRVALTPRGFLISNELLSQLF